MLLTVMFILPIVSKVWPQAIETSLQAIMIPPQVMAILFQAVEVSLPAVVTVSQPGELSFYRVVVFPKGWAMVFNAAEIMKQCVEPSFYRKDKESNHVFALHHFTNGRQ